MSDWRERLGDRLVTAEQAAGMVKSGQNVTFAMGRECYAFGLALASRMGELEDVKIITVNPGYDFGWYDEGWQDAFKVQVSMPTAVCQEAVNARLVDVHPHYFFNNTRPIVFYEKPDILAVEVSPPDERGFCSFGQSTWNKKRQIREAQNIGTITIAEVNEGLIRTYGDNFIHFSEINYFVEHVSSGAAPSTGTLAGRAKREPEPYLKDIAKNIGALIRDGDCTQIGVGRTTEPLVNLGMFDGKNDLGVHSEATAPGIIRLVREGQVNGRRKTLHEGKVVVTSLGGGTKEEMNWASNNPIFELVDVEYLEDIRVISANDNMVSINNALCIDLTGLMSAEALGHQIISQAGGQLPFLIGALMSKGGRAFHVLPSTALGGKVSRIMPDLPLGTPVSVPRQCMDYVVTEYGVARLWGKSFRQRAEALIEIAHPDFRDELRAAARARFWP